MFNSRKALFQYVGVKLVIVEVMYCSILNKLHLFYE